MSGNYSNTGTVRIIKKLQGSFCDNYIRDRPDALLRPVGDLHAHLSLSTFLYIKTDSYLSACRAGEPALQIVASFFNFKIEVSDCAI